MVCESSLAGVEKTTFLSLGCKDIYQSRRIVVVLPTRLFMKALANRTVDEGYCMFFSNPAAHEGLSQPGR